MFLIEKVRDPNLKRDTLQQLLLLLLLALIVTAILVAFLIAFLMLYSLRLFFLSVMAQKEGDIFHLNVPITCAHTW